MTDHELILTHCCDDLHMRPAHGHRPTPTCSCGWKGTEHLATLWAKREWEEHVNYGDASTQPMPSGTPESWDPGDAHCTACGGSGLVGDQKRRAAHIPQPIRLNTQRLSDDTLNEIKEAWRKTMTDYPYDTYIDDGVCLWRHDGGDSWYPQVEKQDGYETLEEITTRAREEGGDPPHTVVIITTDEYEELKELAARYRDLNR